MLQALPRPRVLLGLKGLGALGAGEEEEREEGEDQQSPHLWVAGILHVHLAVSLVPSPWGIRTTTCY